MNNACLLVIDFINDIVNAKGKIAGSAAYVAEHKVMEHANQAITFARNNKIPVVLVKVGFHANYAEVSENSPIFTYAKKQEALQLNTWGTEFHDAIQQEANDLVIVKHRISAFYATALEAFLRAKKIETLIICGVSSDMAVQITAREAHDRDYKVIVLRDACGAGTKELHENAMKLLERLTKVISVEELGAVDN